MKKLKDAEEKEKKQEEASQKKGGQDAFILNSPLVVSFYESTSTKQKPSFIFFQLPKISSEILHPPPAKFFS
ncbi:hypothetical protein [Pedobacter sp. MC2016-24]|uniref:hypothetical protein n=1 Tax=Pedobacter sp. MC2016-24 TaxID=2780090 RepID=UPI001D1631B9|nr:hypothetical protein [Pedobacter sp. MC2016-24]